jgi:SAM-dependent methyltransferase
MTDHDHQHGSPSPPVRAEEWDEMYAGADRVWSGNPNGALIAEASDLIPGTAIDLGCGEGADAVWLAQRGWDVTAVDVSSVALERAAGHIAASGVAVTLLHGGLLDLDLQSASFDLVSVQYPALLHEQGRSLAAILALVGPVGTLLFVHHANIDTEQLKGRGLDPADYLLPPDVYAALDKSWDVQYYEHRARHVENGAGARHVQDLVLRARRLA